MHDVPSLEELLGHYRAEWRSWISCLRFGDMLQLKLDPDALAVIGTREEVTGILMCIRNLPKDRNDIVDTVIDVWINTLSDDGSPRGHTTLGYVDVRELTVVSRYDHSDNVDPSYGNVGM